MAHTQQNGDAQQFTKLWDCFRICQAPLVKNRQIRVLSILLSVTIDNVGIDFGLFVQLTILRNSIQHSRIGEYSTHAASMHGH